MTCHKPDSCPFTTVLEKCHSDLLNKLLLIIVYDLLFSHAENGRTDRFQEKFVSHYPHGLVSKIFWLVISNSQLNTILFLFWILLSYSPVLLKNAGFKVLKEMFIGS